MCAHPTIEDNTSKMEQSKKPHLSVIVPAYNVELYLDKCLQSICDQTFTDFELILVNDGSTDNTLSVCQAWAQRDKRIRLIDQKNQGLAEVRNIGLREARADLIMFVDSDDWLELDAIEVLLELKKRRNAQISVGRFVMEEDEGQKYVKHVGNRVFTGQRAYLLNLYDHKLRSYCWAKIYDKSLFDGIVYPVGQYLEDYSVTHLLFLRAQRVACTNKTVYHYLIRKSSILGDKSLYEVRTVTYFAILTERLKHARTEGQLTEREFTLLRMKFIRRIIRTFWKERPKGYYMPGTKALESLMDFLAFACGEPVQESDFKRIYAWTRRKKITTLLFGR